MNAKQLIKEARHYLLSFLGVNVPLAGNALLPNTELTRNSRILSVDRREKETMKCIQRHDICNWDPPFRTALAVVLVLYVMNQSTSEATGQQTDLQADVSILGLEDNSTDRLTFTIADERSPTLSPDGRSIAFEFLGAIYVQRIDDGPPTRVTLPMTCFSPKYSPREETIAFYGSKSSPDQDLYLVSPDGEDLKNLTNTSDVSEVGPTWTSDGEKVLYIRAGSPSEIWQYSLQEEECSFVATGPEEVLIAQAASFPDGHRILAMGKDEPPNSYSLYVYDRLDPKWQMVLPEISRVGHMSFVSPDDVVLLGDPIRTEDCTRTEYGLTVRLVDGSYPSLAARDFGRCVFIKAEKVDATQTHGVAIVKEGESGARVTLDWFDQYSPVVIDKSSGTGPSKGYENLSDEEARKTISWPGAEIPRQRTQPAEEE